MRKKSTKADVNNMTNSTVQSDAKKNKYITLVLFVIIAVISAFLRFYKLGVVPISPDWDEAAIGYNAYSILHTGKDEYGTFLPVSLRSFDDYKPPLYMYLAIPGIALSGLNIWTVRMPSAILGTLSVIISYFLVKFFLTINGKKLRNDEWLPLLTMALLAISPWHLQFSRIAFEANIGLSLNIFFITAFALGLAKNPRWFIFSAICAALSLYAYHSERIFTPLIILILGVLYRSELKKYRKYLFVSIIVGCCVLLPLFISFANPNTWARLKGTSSLSDQTALLWRTVEKINADKERGDMIGPLLDNRRFVYVKTIAEGYLYHFSLKWLFINGDNDRHHAPGMGLLYLVELPFLLWGAYSLVKSRTKIGYFLLLWFLISPIPASPTSGLPHAIRTLIFLPTFQIFTAYGILRFLHFLHHMKNKFIVFAGIVGICVLFIFNMTYYFHMYYSHLNHEYSQFWQYGYKEAVEYVRNNKTKYEKIVVSTKLEQPYMFFLFYLKYDPATYLSEGGTASGGFAEKNNRFSLYEFRPIEWATEKRDGKTLYIGTPKEIPDSSIIKYIDYLDGSGAMRIGV